MGEKDSILHPVSDGSPIGGDSMTITCELGDYIYDAEKSMKPVEPFTECFPDITVDEA